MHINIFEIEVEVPDSNRARCYQLLLERCYKEIIKYLAEQSKYTADMFTSINPVMKSILEGLAKQLDDEFIDIIDRDLAKYRVDLINRFSLPFTKKYTQAYFDNLSAKEAQQELTKYYGNPDVFAKRIQKEYADEYEFCASLTQQFIHNTKTTLKRIISDADLLVDCFLGDLHSPKLRRIIFSGSDLHKHGQQVLMLEFIDQDGHSRRVVYKPAPLVADAMLFGDVQTLARINPIYEGHQSFSELMNGFMNSKLLPTYLIVPRSDDDTLNGQYGYIEFLTHQPGGPDYENVFLEQVKLLDSKQFEQTNFQEIANQALSTQLKLAKKNPNCDYIAINDSDIDTFSQTAGYLLVLMIATGMDDSHAENIMTHLKQPFPIDGEVCLFVGKDLVGLCQLAPDGALNNYSKIGKQFKFLTDISGKKTIHVVTNDNNILYKESPSGELVPCDFNKELLIRSVRNGMTLLATHEDQVMAWFDDPIVQQMFVRFIPQSTSRFKEELGGIKRKKFSKKEYEAYAIGKINDHQTGLDLFASRVQAYNKTLLIGPDTNATPAIYLDKSLPPLPVPWSVIFTNDLFEKNILSEYKTNSIPVFYIRAGGKQLFDFNGDPVLIPENFSLIQQTIGTQRTAQLSIGQRYQVHRENPAITGADIHLVEDLPKDIQKFKGNYFWIEKEPLDQSKLYYVSFNGMLEEPMIDDVETLRKFILAGLQPEDKVRHLTLDELYQLSKLLIYRKKDELFVYRSDLPSIRGATDKNFMIISPLQFTKNRLRKLFDQPLLYDILLTVITEQIIRLQPYDKNLMKQEIALNQLKYLLAQLIRSRRESPKDIYKERLDVNVVFKEGKVQLLFACNIPVYRLAMLNTLKRLGIPAEIDTISFQTEEAPRQMIVISGVDENTVLKSKFREDLILTFSIELVKLYQEVNEVTHLVGVQKWQNARFGLIYPDLKDNYVELVEIKALIKSPIAERLIKLGYITPLDIVAFHIPRSTDKDRTKNYLHALDKLSRDATIGTLIDSHTLEPREVKQKFDELDGDLAKTITYYATLQPVANTTMISTQSFTMFSHSSAQNDDVFTMQQSEFDYSQFYAINVQELANVFYHWMKHEKHPQQADNKHLIEWLVADAGALYIRDYQHLCELAQELDSYGYQTIPAPSEDDYNDALQRFIKKERGIQKPHANDRQFVSFDFNSNQKNISKPTSLSEFADKFDHWMKHGKHVQQSDNKHLLDWLVADAGAQYMENYQHFCALAQTLIKYGYQTNTPPSESDFNLAREKYKAIEKESSYNTNTVNKGVSG